MAERLKPFERRYTPEQRKAIVHAMLDAQPRLTAREAVERAAAGTLPGTTVAPFGQERRADGAWVPIPQQTALYWRKIERRERGELERPSRAKTEPDNALRAAIADAWEDIEKAREAARKAKLSPTARMRAAREYLSAARAVHDAQKQLAGKEPPAPSTEPKRDAPTEAADLAAAARQRATTEQHDAPPTDTAQGSASVTDQGDASEQQQHETHSVAREQAQHESANGHAITPQAVRYPA